MCEHIENESLDGTEGIILLRKGGLADKKMIRALMGNLLLQPDGGMVSLPGQIVYKEECSYCISR